MLETPANSHIVATGKEVGTTSLLPCPHKEASKRSASHNQNLQGLQQKLKPAKKGIER